jgi:hypothetical protein
LIEHEEDEYAPPPPPLSPPPRRPCRDQHTHRSATQEHATDRIHVLNPLAAVAGRNDERDGAAYCASPAVRRGPGQPPQERNVILLESRLCVATSVLPRPSIADSRTSITIGATLD